MAPGAQQLLQSYAAQVNLELEKIFDTPLQKWIGVTPSDHAIKAFEYLQEYTLRPSKRVRGALTAFSYDQASNSRFGKPGLVTSAAIELAQSYLLIVDDIMDRSMLRRGKASIHELYRRDVTDVHTADMLALCVGLVASHMINLILSLADVDPDRLAKTNEIMHRNLLITGLGQLEDLYQHKHAAANKQQIIDKYKFKTSYYTFVNPIQAGMIMGGVDNPEILQESVDFGEAAGIAYQLHDDILGIYGDSEATGKANSDDVEEGKQTLLLVYATEHCNESDKQILQSIIGKNTVTINEMDEIRRIMDESGARRFVSGEAKRYARQAKQSLNASSFWDEESKAALKELIDYSVTRKK